MSAFRDKLATAAAKIRGQAGEAIIYRRGLSSCAIADAIPPNSNIRSRPNDNVAVDVSIQDWIFAVSDLVIEDEATVPQRGDLIEWSESGARHLYEVLPIDGDSVYHLTAGRSQFRIHTKRIEGEIDDV
jgi:hypothetical protein